MTASVAAPLDTAPPVRGIRMSPIAREVLMTVWATEQQNSSYPKPVSKTYGPAAMGLVRHGLAQERPFHGITRIALTDAGRDLAAHLEAQRAEDERRRFQNYIKAAKERLAAEITAEVIRGLPGGAAFQDMPTPKATPAVKVKTLRQRRHEAVNRLRSEHFAKPEPTPILPPSPQVPDDKLPLFDLSAKPYDQDAAQPGYMDWATIKAGLEAKGLTVTKAKRHGKHK